MTYAWGEEAAPSHTFQGVESRYNSANPHEGKMRRQHKDKSRRSGKKERRHKSISLTSLPAMQATSSLRSILKPSTSTESLVRSNYLDKRCRIEDVYGTVPPGVRAYWMREQQLRKSLKRGKKVQFHDNSGRNKRGVGFSEPNPKHNGHDVYYDDDDEDEDSDDRFGQFRSDEESYCKKRVLTPMVSRRSRIRAGSASTLTGNDPDMSIVPDMGSVQDFYDGSSSSNYSFCPNEMTANHERSQMGGNPVDLERSMFVRGCVKVAADPNEDIIAFNEMRRQSINRINAFVRSSGRYSQRGYQAYSSAVNKRINAPTRRSMRGNPECGDEYMTGAGDRVYVPMNDPTRSSLRKSTRGAPNNWPSSGEDAPYQGPFTRSYRGGPGGGEHFERSNVRSFRRSNQSGTLGKQDGTMTRGSTRRKSHRRRSGTDNVAFPDARESVRRSRHRREGFSNGGGHRQSTRRHTTNVSDLPETHYLPPVNIQGENSSDWPSSRSSSPYFVRPVAHAPQIQIQEEIKVPQERPLPPLPPPIPPSTPVDNGVQEDNVRAHFEPQDIQPMMENTSVSGRGGVPTVGGETSVQCSAMLPLAEAVVAGALRRSARQKKRGIAYFTYRKGRGEVVSDLEVIKEDQPGRYSPVSTEGHWSAPESTRPKVAPKPPPRPPQRPTPGLCCVPYQQPVPVMPAPPMPGYTGRVAYEQPVPVIPAPVPSYTGRVAYEQPIPVMPAPPVPGYTGRVAYEQPVPVIPAPPVPSYTGRVAYEEPVKFKPVPAPASTRSVSDDEPVPISELLFGKPSQMPSRKLSKTISKSVDNKPISMVDAAQQLEKKFAHIGGRSPPPMSASESQEATEKENTKAKEPQKTKEHKSKKQHKKKKKKGEEEDDEEKKVKKEGEEEKKTKKKEEKEKKEKKKEKKKKKKKKEKSKAKTAGDADGVKRSQSEGTQQSAKANTKSVTKKPLKPPRKYSSVAGSEVGPDSRRGSSEQGHLTVIKVVDSGAGSEDNHRATPEAGFKNESGLTRLSRKISDRVGTWGKDFKRLLRFRREKTADDSRSETEDDNIEINDVTIQPDEVEHPPPQPAVIQNQMDTSGANLRPQTRSKVPLLPPRCIPVPVPVPPPEVPSIKNDEDDLNFCDEGKTNQIIYWLQNVASEDHIAMLTTTTVATQF